MQLWNLIPEDKHINFRLSEQFDGNPTWNAELEILYVLSGSLNCMVRGTTYQLDEEAFIVFNPYEMHSTSGHGCKAVSLFIYPTLLSLRGNKRAEEQIFCCSCDASAPEACYAAVRQRMADILLLFYQENLTDTYQLYGNVLNLLSVLDENFRVRREAATSREQNVTEHMQKVVRYMDEHYMENLTLAQVAKTEFISANYLSHLFRSYLNTSFVQYLRMLRLKHAYSDLVNTDRSITEIAMRHGFSSSTAFIQYFREIYGKTPAKFRKSAEHGSYYRQAIPTDDESLHALTRHATRAAKTSSLLRNIVETRSVAVDCSQTGHLRPQSWNELMNVGWAKELLLAPLQQQVLRAVRTLGFRSIRFHGIFDDDMFIYHEDEDGTVSYNFNYLEMLFDFLIGNGLVPFLELGFIPHKLASNDTLYYNHYSSICLPKDMERWQALVENTLRHCINRYGIKEVSRWRFTLFNSVYVYYNCISEEDWWTLWLATGQVIKRVNPALQYGLNDDLGLLGPSYQRLWNYLERSIQSGCTPDFLAFQCFYGDYYASGDLSFGMVYDQKEMPLPHSPDENYLAHKLDDLEAEMARRHIARLPVLFEAWNSTVWQRDACNDGCFKSAFLLKNILENEDRLQAFGHWTLSDFMEEVPHSPELFHGGYGVLTYNGIPKPGYYALLMLSQLTEHCIGRGNGWYVTSDGEDIHILMYHYYHYDLLYQRHYTVKRDSVFKFENSISFQVDLNHLLPGDYEFVLQSVNRENGSSYDTWLDMGAPEYLTRDQIEYIKQVAKPRLEKWMEHVSGSYAFTAQLRAHEVQLVTIHRMH